MSFVTPKTNWNNDNVGDDDFNRIEEDIRVLHQGGGIPDGDSLTPVTTTGPGYALDIGTELDTFLMNPAGELDVYTIHSISTTGRSATNKIYIINTGIGFVSFIVDQTAASGYAPIMHNGNFSLRGKESAELVFIGDYWYIINKTYQAYV